MSSHDRLPVARGYDSSFGYLSGAEDHYNQKRDGYVDFWRDTKPAYGENNTGYATYAYTREALRIIDEKEADKPMFLYLAFQVSQYDPAVVVYVCV